MSRVKTFDASGVAPNGRLFATDLNAIQDRYADLVNYGQSLGASVYAIGDATLQLLRFAVGEARITGSFRADGILRGLGGLMAGTFTTTQRDAIPAGSRPTGLVIYNSTTGQYEVNTGSDATPAWRSFGAPAGTIQMYGGDPAPAGYLLCDGTSYLRADYPALFSAIGTGYGAADGTHFNVPSFATRVPVGKGGSGFAQNLGNQGGEQNHVLTVSELPSHDHATPTILWTDNLQTGGGTKALTDWRGNTGSGATHSFTDDVNNNGGGASHNNLQPYIVVNFIIKT